MSLNQSQNTVSIVKNNLAEQNQPDAPAADDDEYGDEYYEEEEEEEEPEDPQQQQNKPKPQDAISNDTCSKLKRIVESQPRIPRIIIIKDSFGVEQEYEVLEESEEEEDIEGSINMSVSRHDGQDQSLKFVNKGQPGEQLSTRRRVLIEGENMGDESFYIEEIIEESEEESDEMDDIGRGQRQAAAQ